MEIPVCISAIWDCAYPAFGPEVVRMAPSLMGPAGIADAAAELLPGALLFEVLLELPPELHAAASATPAVTAIAAQRRWKRIPPLPVLEMNIDVRFPLSTEL
jgi:hypothetical protein